MTSNSISFYIPRMLARTREEDVKKAFNDIGNVYRIDFTEQGKKPGFVENIKGEYKSAFVHFDSIFEKGFRINVWIRSGEQYKLYPYRNSDEYWFLLQTKSPIQHTMMNNAQIVANCRVLEKKVTEQAAKIEEQAETIKALAEKLEGVQSVVYQLLGGLFCQKSQSQILKHHLTNLFPEEYCGRTCCFELDDNIWTAWPTTRQGDNCESRIEALEKQFKELTDFDPTLLQHDEESLSTSEERVIPITIRKTLDYNDLFQEGDSSDESNYSTPELSIFKSRSELQRLYLERYEEPKKDDEN